MWVSDRATEKLKPIMPFDDPAQNTKAGITKSEIDSLLPKLENDEDKNLL
jgi:hypothetical protein